ncbi:Hypothetical protein DHA2_151197 [Giardia duodenalis]|uniref:Uncharacterized protein n=1 Tax=Giardia intestinalis TaxID=5741 RepID=V6TKW8_GIAIN|nr:Hypothetical protein DHA2_151197 [Giardia intestinalis]
MSAPPHLAIKMPSSLTQKIEAAQLKEELLEAQRFIAQLQLNYAEKCSEAEILRVECKQIHGASEQRMAELHAVVHQLQSQLSVKEQEHITALSDAKAKHMEVVLLQEQLKVTQASYTQKIDELAGKMADYERQVHLLQQQQHHFEGVDRASSNEKDEKEASSSEHCRGLSMKELKEDLMVLNVLNKELETKLRATSEEVADLARQVQRLSDEKTQLMMEKTLRETFYSEKIDALTRTIDTINCEKSKLQEMYNKAMTEYYNLSLAYNILLSTCQKREEAPSKAVTILRQVCIHDPAKAPRQHVISEGVGKAPCPNCPAVLEPRDNPAPSFPPNLELMKFGEVDIGFIKPKGVKVKTQAGVSFVPETKKLLQIRKADSEKIPRVSTL